MALSVCCGACGRPIKGHKARSRRAREVIGRQKNISEKGIKDI